MDPVLPLKKEEAKGIAEYIFVKENFTEMLF